MNGKMHIVGAGPTGLALAWELRRSGQDVTVYERKPSAGGSWWEPDLTERNLHAHRILFDRAWVNARSLLEEMDIPWTDLFQKHDDQVFAYMFKSLALMDYLVLLSLPFVASKERTVKDVFEGKLSEGGQRFIEHLPLVIDGVPWDVMSSHELLSSVNHVALSGQWTQKVSGKVMGDRMQEALERVGVKFVFNTELTSLDMGEDTYVAKMSNGDTLSSDLLVLCVDHSPARKLVKDNWGPDGYEKLTNATYGCINVLLDYPDGAPPLRDDLEVAATTPWKLQPRVLSDGKTVACVICNLTEELLTTDPETLKRGVIEQLEVPPPPVGGVRIGWGATWSNGRWQFSQSSGVLTYLPFYGRCSKVALCGMMSERTTPYASLEAAVEVARSFAGVRRPLDALRLSHLLFIIFVLLVVCFVVVR
jgi:2-polyprenyl-6-methoxyphenol hydroxylase-like FAD-dependent oxidoreductase